MAKKKRMSKSVANKKKKMRESQRQKEVRRRKIQLEKEKNEKILRLEKEKEELKKLKAELHTRRINNLKAMGIRNLKVFAAAGRFVMPYILVGTLSLGTVRLLGGGYPFVTDEVKCTKEFFLDYKTGENLYYETSFNTDKVYEDHLFITTPWVLNAEGLYEKYEREYVIDNDNISEIFDAILAEDFDYILEHIAVKKEKRITSTSMDVSEEENYLYVDAHIDGVDNDAYIYVDETFARNFWCSLGDFALAAVLGYLVANVRKFSVSSRIETINEEYKKVFVLNDELCRKITGHKEAARRLRKELNKYGK